MAQFQYQWWTVEAREATGRIVWEIKAKSKDGAVKQIKKIAAQHDAFIQKARPDFKTEVFWDTLTLDRTGYQRLF